MDAERLAYRWFCRGIATSSRKQTDGRCDRDRYRDVGTLSLAPCLGPLLRGLLGPRRLATGDGSPLLRGLLGPRRLASGGGSPLLRGLLGPRRLASGGGSPLLRCLLDPACPLGCCLTDRASLLLNLIGGLRPSNDRCRFAETLLDPAPSSRCSRLDGADGVTDE